LFQNEKIELKNKETDHFSVVDLEMGKLISIWTVVVYIGVQMPKAADYSPLDIQDHPLLIRCFRFG